MAVAEDITAFYRLATLSRIMNVGVLLLDPAANIEFSNSLGCELLGCFNEDHLKSRWSEIRPLLRLKLQTPNTSKPLRVITDIPQGNVVRSLRLEIYGLNEHACKGYLILLRDRQAIGTSETELLLASQMRAMSHLHSALVHDLRAPLHTMQITLELLADSISDGASRPLNELDQEGRKHRYVRVLREELARLNRTLQFVLNQSGPLDSAPQKFDLRDLIKEITALLGPQARKQRVEVKTQVPEVGTRVQGYRDRLKQALLNIAINSLEAMTNGGELTINVKLHDQFVQIIFEDNGTGIPAGLLDEIPQKYLTTKEGGSGIGLYVAQMVFESHGGELTIESTHGSGTCVQGTLPLNLYESF